MAGKHTGPRDWLQNESEWIAWHLATKGVVAQIPLTGRHHLTCAPAIIRAHYNRWNASTERQHTGGDPDRVVQGR